MEEKPANKTLLWTDNSEILLFCRAHWVWVFFWYTIFPWSLALTLHSVVKIKSRQNLKFFFLTCNTEQETSNKFSLVSILCCPLTRREFFRQLSVFSQVIVCNRSFTHIKANEHRTEKLVQKQKDERLFSTFSSGRYTAHSARHVIHCSATTIKPLKVCDVVKAYF